MGERHFESKAILQSTIGFRAYSKYLAEQEEKKETKITDADPDRIYKPFGISRTQIDKDQEYTKISDE